MRNLILKIIISVLCIAAVVLLFFWGDRILPVDDAIEKSGQERDEYLDIFQFNPKELSYDGTGDLNLLDGVSLEGYAAQELKEIVFTRIYAGDTLSEKYIQYTAETENGKVRSVRLLKLYNYNAPKIQIPKEIPEVTRAIADDFNSLLVSMSGYAVDDGFGNDVREYAVVQYEADEKESALLHYRISFDNMFGDGDVAKVDVTLSGEPAYLTLTDSEVELRVGDKFEPGEYVAKAVFSDGEDAFSKVMYNGDVDTSRAGTYKVKYNLEGEELTLLVNVIQ